MSFSPFMLYRIMVKIPWYPFGPTYRRPKKVKLVMSTSVLQPHSILEQVEVHGQPVPVQAHFTPHGALRGSPGVPEGHLIPQAVSVVD
jgi:hypothetical protein